MKVLLKLGGAALTSPAALGQTTELIRGYRERGDQVWLVHGGGPAINEALKARAITWSFVNGQRVTSPEMIEVIEQTLAGEVNSRVVNFLNDHRVPAVGFSGAADRILRCRPAAEELGLVGEVCEVDVRHLINEARLPVIAPLGCGPGTARFNINADWAAAHLAVALGVDELLFLTDQDGILGEDQAPIARISDAGLARLIDGEVVRGGMLTKTRAIRHALNHGVKFVRVGRADRGTRCDL